MTEQEHDVQSLVKVIWAERDRGDNWRTIAIVLAIFGLLELVCVLSLNWTIP